MHEAGRDASVAMPIKPEYRNRYPKGWRDIRARILGRAHDCCEQCGVFNHDWGYRGELGEFHRVRKRPLRDAGYRQPPFDLSMHDDYWNTKTVRVIEIVLTIAHLDHIPENCDDANLKALCQRCHLRYDARHHAETRRRIPGQAEMF